MSNGLKVNDPVFEELTDIGGMAQRIKEDQYSACVFNTLKLHAEKNVNNYTFYVPKKHPDSHVLLWLDGNSQTALSLYCAQDELQLLKELLKETKMVDFRSSLFFFHLDDGVLEVVQEVSREINNKELETRPCSVFVYRPTGEEEGTIRCPAAFEVHRLNEAGVRFMYNKWHYKDCSLRLDHFLSLAESCPTAGVYRSESAEHPVIVAALGRASGWQSPVSYATLTHYGLLSLLRTERGFTRRGFASLVMATCGRLMIQGGFLPVACAHDVDTEAIRMFEKTGEWDMAYRVTWAWRSVDGSPSDSGVVDVS